MAKRKTAMKQWLLGFLLVLGCCAFNHSVVELYLTADCSGDPFYAAALNPKVPCFDSNPCVPSSSGAFFRELCVSAMPTYRSLAHIAQFSGGTCAWESVLFFRAFVPGKCVGVAPINDILTFIANCSAPAPTMALCPPASKACNMTACKELHERPNTCVAEEQNSVHWGCSSSL